MLRRMRRKKHDVLKRMKQKKRVENVCLSAMQSNIFVAPYHGAEARLSDRSDIALLKNGLSCLFICPCLSIFLSASVGVSDCLLFNYTVNHISDIILVAGCASTLS